MTNVPDIAILAGARETPDIARGLRDHACVALWARGAAPVALCCPVVTRLPDTLAGIVAVTHPFDTRTRLLAADHTAPFASVRRAPWQADGAPGWHEVDTLDAALARLPRGARIFAATGRRSARTLARHDGPVFLRQLSHHDHAPPPGCTFVFGAGPFDLAGELARLRDLRIDVVVARNLGGTDSYPKIAAARALGLPVVLLRAPAPLRGPVFSTPDQVRAWAATL